MRVIYFSSPVRTKMVTPMLSYYGSYLQLRVPLSWAFSSRSCQATRNEAGAHIQWVLGSSGPRVLGPWVLDPKSSKGFDGVVWLCCSS